MKRKLDVNDVPTAGTPSDAAMNRPTTSTASFESLGLDPRLLQAISKSKYSEPTPVQAKAIPLAIQGKDILAKSKPGSGKTAAYVLPTLQLVLQHKSVNPKEKSIQVLVLVPTRELSDQVSKVYMSLGEFCSKEIRCLNLTQRATDAVLNAKLHEHPDIVVSTPGRVAQLLTSGTLSLENVLCLVIDEADLVLSYGYEDDMSGLSKTLPKGIQTFLMSATLTPEIEELKAMFCRDPVTIKIDDGEEQGEHVAQYVVKCGEEEKFLLIFVIFKLKLVKGKCIVFVADVDRSYRLKLYLEQYGIKSCVLNSELPVNSRLRVVEEFNKGLYDILVAADDQEVIGGILKKSREREPDADVELTDEDEGVEIVSRKQEKGPRDYGVSRGIDFQNVSCVLNFDLPPSSKSYTHRIGRTARAGKAGMALSFVIPRDEYGKHKPTSQPACRHDEKVLAKIIARQEKKGNEIKPYQFDMEQVAAFRYRMNDALRAVTRVAVREARAREIKQELVRSEKLRKHFEENPEDLKHLRRSDGGALGGGGVIRIQGHMKHVPEYLLPEKGSQSAENAGFVGINGDENHRKRKRKGFKKSGRKGGKNDPLKTFRTGRK